MGRQRHLIVDTLPTRLWAAGLALLVLAVVLIVWTTHSRSEASRVSLPPGSPPQLTLTDGVERVFVPPGKAEAPSLSTDGRALVYAQKIYEDELLDYEIDSVWLARPDASGRWETAPLVEGRRAIVGEMRSYFNPSFDADGRRVFTGNGSFWNVLVVPVLPSVRVSLDVVSLADRQLRRFVAPADLGMPKEVILHPKVSPDGRWLAFYTRKRKETRGIYLLHLETRRLHRVSAEDDKHPTWAPDGKRLLFHHQRGGQAVDPVPKGFPEQAYLGYFDLTFDGRDGVSARRVLMDPVADHYVYRKHPTLPPGTDLVFFHSRLEPAGPHLLMVRRLGIETPAHLVAAVVDGERIKEAKHPATAVTSPEFLFLGKSRREKEYSFYRLTPAALRAIDAQLPKA